MTEQQTPMGLDTMEDDDSDMITIRSKDHQTFRVPRKVASSSNFINTMLVGDTSVSEVSLSLIEGEICKRIIDYMHYHEKVAPPIIQKPLKSTKMEDLVDAWDVAFCDCSQELMLKLLLAANYLDLAPLLMLMSAKVASTIKDKTPEEIRVEWNISSEYTVEEEEAVRREYDSLID